MKMRATRRRRKRSFDELVSDYYGKDPGERRPTAVATSLSRDDGEVLKQEPKGAPAAPAAPAPAAEGEEYVVWNVAAAAPAAPAAPAPAEPVAAQASMDVAPSQEYALDVTRPLEDVTSALAAPASTTATQGATVEEDELAADMQAILSGQKVYDPATGTTVDRDLLGGQGPAPAPEPSPRPPMSNEQAIFDAIADSMKYANAYDLGTVELENRFTDFDRMSDLEQKAREAKRTSVERASAVVEPKVGGAEFLKDLDAIRERAEAVGEDAVQRAAEAMPIGYTSSIADWSDAFDRDATCAPSALKLRLAEPDPTYARPMFDAGEHAWAGGDLYPDQLRVGRAPGVTFSYGELLAMGDLYGSVDELMNTDTAELTRIKALIDRSTAYYKTNKTTDSLDVSHEEWDSATGGRYLKLAEDNYEHFSPNVLFNDATARAANRHGTNRSAWEAHHQRAIEEAQKLALRPENANRSYIPEWPLIINGFGDHFLTDAFASGHLINKEVMVAYFRANFFSGGKLNDAAEKFFKRVAEQAFVGDVRKKFSVLETADYPVCAWGWCFKWHPNIDSVNMFRKLLVEAAKQEPEKVANFAVKALHDRLNKDGIKVTNAAGEPEWTLTGDGYLNPQSLAIMQKAVQQSVDNINDPSILASNLNFGPYFQKVWRYVPQPTAASQKQLTNLVREYTNPNSTVLSSAAAEVIRKQVDSLINVLLKENKLKRA